MKVSLGWVRKDGYISVIHCFASGRTRKDGYISVIHAFARDTTQNHGYRSIIHGLYFLNLKRRIYPLGSKLFALSLPPAHDVDQENVCEKTTSSRGRLFQKIVFIFEVDFEIRVIRCFDQAEGLVDQQLAFGITSLR